MFVAVACSLIYSLGFLPLLLGGVNKQDSGGKRVCSVARLLAMS